MSLIRTLYRPTAALLAAAGFAAPTSAVAQSPFNFIPIPFATPMGLALAVAIAAFIGIRAAHKK